MTTNEATTTTGADPEDKSALKEEIYDDVNKWVTDKTGKNIGKTGGRAIFDLVVSGIFAAAAKQGMFRFNGGFGALHVRDYGSGSRRLPSGQVTTFGDRQKLRYEEGVVTSELVKNKGDLQSALQVRGSRERKTNGNGATTPAAEATTAPATEAATKKTRRQRGAPTPVVADATATEGVDLD
jgi:hypothetical protein